MAGEFLVSEDRLVKLRATRSGRISYAGYNFQCGYAVSRLASMVTAKPLLGVTDFPRLLRYDWAEDLDELLDDGSVCFTQCKRVDDIGQPAKLADILLGFAPKWLWTPQDKRDRLRFRLVSCDPQFRNGFNRADFQAETLSQFKKRLETDPGPNSDRSLWQTDAIAVGIEPLFDALWSKFSVVPRASASITDDPAGPLLVSEAEARELLLIVGLATSSTQKAAISALRRLIHDGLISFDPTNEECPSLARRTPLRIIEAADVRLALFSKNESRRQPAFGVVDRVALSIAREQPKEKFLFESPEWRHVVHGTDTDIKFIERDQTDSLRERLCQSLIQPLLRGTSNLPVLFVTGAPGAGKSTLVRRVAATLVESGDVVVADAGLNLAGGPSDVQSYAEELQELAAAGRPVLLVLDDPLFAESGWIDLLIHLKQPGFQVAVIAATPNFLWQQYRSQLTKVSCTPFVMRPPTPHEKQRFAEIYDLDVATFGQHSDDFLAMVAEAESGEHFPQIMDRLWQTLNHGRPFDSNVSFRELPYEVRAFWFVCFIHRCYTLCPMANLKAALELSGGSGTTTDTETALAKLRTQSGWNIFRFHRSTESAENSQDDFISVAHQKIASVAWDRRPMPWFDDEVDKILAQSTVMEPQSIRNFATAVAVMAKPGSSSRSRFVQELVARWQKTASDSRRLTTRNLCELAGILMSDRRIKVTGFGDTIRSRATGKDGWLAALQLWLMSADEPKSRSFPSDLDLIGLIAIADFSIQPNYADHFLNAVSADTTLRNAIYQRLFASLEGNLNWRLGPSLVAWLLSHAPVQECAKRFRTIADSLRRHDYHSLGRRYYLKLLQALPAAFDDERKQAVIEIADWLKRHDRNAEVRTHYLKFLEGLPATFDDQRKQAVIDTADWLKRHDDDTFVRTKYLSLLKGLPPTFEDQRKQAAIEIAEWLKRHDEDSYVRTQYLSFLRRLPGGFDDQRRQALVETVDWLKRHDDNANVRTQYFSLLLELPAPFDDYRRQAVIETADWLGRHENDSFVRIQYLAFLQELSTTFDDQRIQVAKATADWLERHPDSNDVRSKYLKFLRFVPAPELKPLREVSDKHHQQLIAKDPKKNDFAYAEQLVILRRFEDAIAQYDIVLKRHQGHEMALRGRAFALQKLGRMTEAESEFKDALLWAGVHKVSEAKFHTSLGEFYLETKRWREAIKSFEQAQKEFPSHFSNHWGIARAHVGLGNHRQAVQALERAQQDVSLKPPAKDAILALLKDLQRRGDVGIATCGDGCCC